jgi:vacuolar-type H+-ATPase subunit E/Vma4
MRTVTEEDVEGLSRAILEDARTEAEQILAEARKTADEIRSRTQAQADAERQDILTRAGEEAERLRGQALATAQLKARTMQLDHREKLLEAVFQEATKQLSSVPQWSDYGEIAQALLREALMQLRAGEVEVRADAATLALLTDAVLDGIANEMKVTIKKGKALERGTGVIVEAENGHLKYDNTLDVRLARMQSALRSPIYHLLMGEAL